MTRSTGCPTIETPLFSSNRLFHTASTFQFRIASASADKTVQVWSAATGSTILAHHRHASEGWAVAWSPDSRCLASAEHLGLVEVWSEGEHITTYRGHNGPVFALAWSPDGTRIASASRDKTVQGWSAG